MTVAHLGALAREAPADTLPGEAPRAGDVASYLHTGGTTGAPKLAARTHGNEVANAWMIGTRLDADGAVFAGLPLFHTNALIVTLLAPLLRGQPVVWAGPLGYRDPALFSVFWQLVERYRIAAMSAVPTVYAALATLPVDADISSLRMPIVGAAPLPRAVVDAFLERTGVELCEGYGLTEGTCASACHIPGVARAGRGAAPAVSAGARRARRSATTGSRCPTARSARCSSRSQRLRRLSGRDARGPARGGREGPGRVAEHRRPRMGRRRRQRAAGRPRQGPDHPRRAQHRPGRDRGRAARAPAP